MKKTISLLLVCVLLLGLSACGKAKPAAAEAPAPEAAAQQPAPAAPAVEGAPEAPAPAAAAPESSGQVQAAAPETAPETAPVPAFDPDFQFSATATDGSVYTEQVFAEHPLTIVCCWNAWMEDSVSGLASLEQLYQRYKELGEKEPRIVFGGRLGEYKYYDMDQVIAAALSLSQKELL